MSVETHFTNQQARVLDVDKLTRGPWQPRKSFDPEKLQELAASIEAVGIIEPLVVKFNEQNGLYEIVSGERRWRASQLACVYSVPVMVRNDLSDSECQKIALIENLQREDLNVVDEAEGIRALIDQLNMTHKEAGQAIGKSRSYITNTLKLLALATPVLELLRLSQLEVGHAKYLYTLPDKLQIELAQMSVDRHWSVRDMAKKSDSLKRLLAGEVSSPHPDKDPNLVKLEHLVSIKFCTPTQIEFNPLSGKGKVVFEWNSLCELQGLLQAWDVSLD